MHDALLVGEVQCGGDLVDELDGAGQLQGSIQQYFSQVAAPHETHDQVSALRVAPVVVEGDDMGVFELGDQLGFGLEAADELGLVGVLGQDDLEGYFPVDERLPGAVDDAVGTLTDGFLDLVSFNDWIVLGGHAVCICNLF